LCGQQASVAVIVSLFEGDEGHVMENRFLGDMTGFCADGSSSPHFAGNTRQLRREDFYGR
jgi:hypothetical protein